MISSRWLGIVAAAFFASNLAAAPTISTAYASTSGAVINVSITLGAAAKTDDAYAPNPVQASIGDTVIWTNNDFTLHTAVSGTASDGPNGIFGGTNVSPALIAPVNVTVPTCVMSGRALRYPVSTSVKYDVGCSAMHKILTLNIG